MADLPIAPQGWRESEWELPAGYKTQPCKHCGALITFVTVVAGIVRCLDAEKSRATKSGRLLAPRHMCQERMRPNG